jgi:hypothetical protein
MAQTRSGAANPIVAGFTRRIGPGGALAVGFTSTATSPGGWIGQDSGGFDYYLWFDTSGRLRTTDAATAEAPGFNWNSGGTIVGTQS